MKIHHIALKVDDLEKCRVFYEQLLDLKIIKRHEFEGGNPRSIWFQCGEVILMLEKSEDRAVKKQGDTGWHLLALTIEAGDRDKWKKRLMDAGVEIEKESQHSIYFRDPEGNRLAFSHYPK